MNKFDPFTVFFISIVFFGWGFSVFFDKLAANQLGSKGSWLYIVSYLPSIAILLFFLIWGTEMGGFTRNGIMWVFFSSIANFIALIAYYLVFTKSEASWAVAITALYPICTVILAIIFLHEKITIARTVGIIFAMIALFFLSL